MTQGPPYAGHLPRHFSSVRSARGAGMTLRAQAWLARIMLSDISIEFWHVVATKLLSDTPDLRRAF
jgi:hypothetical protein